MTRRIKKDLLEFFSTKPLTDSEKAFILSCIQCQSKFPQLTSKQWAIVCAIEERYKNESQGRKTTT